jgi:hypothetical protein
MARRFTVVTVWEYIPGISATEYQQAKAKLLA